MKDPRRLLEGGASEIERALLRAAAAEEPPADGPARLAVALGLPASAVAPAPATHAGSAPPPAPIGSAASKLALKWLWVAGGGAALLATALAYRSVSGPQPDAGLPRPPAVQIPPPAAPEPAPSEPRAAAPEAPEAPPVKARPERELEPKRPASKSIAAEVESLDRVRARLLRGDARGALVLLDAHRRAHPAGALQQEAALLRIEALSRAGDAASARRLARAFARDNPQSPHLARIRALVADELAAP